MADRPAIYLHSAAWVNARRRKNEWPPPGYSGRQYHIMRAPNGLHGEVGDGCVRVLVPDQGDEPAMSARLVELRRAKQEDPAEVARYRAALDARWGSLVAQGGLTPSTLWAWPIGGGSPALVALDDTLTCSCSAAESLAGNCHRAIAAPHLVRAGWRVLLDGAEMPDDRRK